MVKEKETVILDREVLDTNDIIAGQNEEFFGQNNVLAINLISASGSGKTILLEKTLQELQKHVECSVITADPATDYDAKRLKHVCDNVCQVNTGKGNCLNARNIALTIPKVVNDKTSVLFIENVSNLIASAEMNLGEHFKIAMLSVPEGDNKASKYPALFEQADVALITKTDLIPQFDFDMVLCRNYIKQINPNITIIEISAETGDGMGEWIGFLRSHFS